MLVDLTAHRASPQQILSPFQNRCFKNSCQSEGIVFGFLGYNHKSKVLRKHPFQGTQAASSQPNDAPSPVVTPTSVGSTNPGGELRKATSQISITQLSGINVSMRQESDVPELSYGINSRFYLQLSQFILLASLLPSFLWLLAISLRFFYFRYFYLPHFSLFVSVF